MHMSSFAIASISAACSFAGARLGILLRQRLPGHHLSKEMQDLVKLSARELREARRSIGMVFQEYNLVERLTVMENLLTGRLGYVASWKAWLRKFPAEDIAEAFELLDVVGFTGFANQRADSLSGGQRQRVAIARALVTEPSIVLADEPTGNLDRGTADKVFALMLQLAKQQGTAFVVVTHDETLAARCDRQLRLVAGRLQP